MLSKKSQQGASLLVFIMALIAAGAAFYFTTLAPESGRTSGQNQTSQSLAKAKQALLSYATTYYFQELGHHAILPCPEGPGSTVEGGQEGTCEGAHENSLGRLPWNSLDIEPLKDSSGECLWYAVSGDFIQNTASPMLNADTPGMFQVFNKNGTLLKGATPEDRVVAVIIAPGAIVTGQNRPAGSGNLPCKVAYNIATPAGYLESYQGINNAFVDDVNDDSIDQFINAGDQFSNEQFNDRLITITTEEIFDAIRSNSQMYQTKLTDLTDDLANCLVTYASTANTNNGGASGGGGGGGTCDGGDLDTCRDNCDAARTLCLLSAPPGPPTAACNTARVDCRRDCSDNCPGPGGGGGGGSDTAFQFPWPASLDLGADYRDPNNYIDDNTFNSRFGRLPIDISSSDAENSTGADLFTFCVNNLPLSLENQNLWSHWKDHFFLAVEDSFVPTNSTSAQDSSSTSCTNCLTVGGTNYAAVLVFSGDRLTQAPFNQLRQDPYIEAGTTLANDKTQLDNYLEGITADRPPLFDISGYSPAEQGLINDRIICFEATSASGVSVANPPCAP